MTQTQDPVTTPGPSGACERYVLWLFVAGDEMNSRQARQHLTQLCEQYLNGCCHIVIHDVLQDFQIALDNHIVVTPTLIRVIPLPRVTIFGNLSNTARVLAALGLDGDKR
jgi:circadian clock protein KaiB